MPYFLTLKAEPLHLADRTCEALEAIEEAEALVERSEERWWCAELYRLRGVFLTRLGANEAQIEEAFCEAIRTAKQQKSTSLATRAEASYAEYRCEKESIRGAGPTASLPTSSSSCLSLERAGMTLAEAIQFASSGKATVASWKCPTTLSNGFCCAAINPAFCCP